MRCWRTCFRSTYNSSLPLLGFLSFCLCLLAPALPVLRHYLNSNRHARIFLPECRSAQAAPATFGEHFLLAVVNYCAGRQQQFRRRAGLFYGRGKSAVGGP